LLAAAKLDKTDAESATAVSTLRRLLSEYIRLSEIAKAAHDAAAYRSWSAAAERVAQSLLPHEVPRLQAVMTTTPDTGDRVTDFVLRIFENERKPLQIEAQAADVTASDDAVTSPERSADAAAIAPEPAKPQAYPEPPPPSPPENPRAPLMSFCTERKSLFEHPSLRPFAPFGSRHRH
jgi:hypothetical protein